MGMFNNKFNPDVVHSFENEDKSRNENKNEVKEKFDKILDERKIKLIKVKKEESIKNVNSLSLDSNYINDFSELRDGFNSDYKEKEDDIVKDREKYNNMIESLLNEGLLG